MKIFNQLIYIFFGINPHFHSLNFGSSLELKWGALLHWASGSWLRCMQGQGHGPWRPLIRGNLFPVMVKPVIYEITNDNHVTFLLYWIRGFEVNYYGSASWWLENMVQMIGSKNGGYYPGCPRDRDRWLGKGGNPPFIGIYTAIIGIPMAWDEWPPFIPFFDHGTYGEWNDFHLTHVVHVARSPWRYWLHTRWFPIDHGQFLKRLRWRIDGIWVLFELEFSRNCPYCISRSRDGDTDRQTDIQAYNGIYI